MSNRNSGGQAFPRAIGMTLGDESKFIFEGGLDKLEYFAAQAPEQPQHWFYPTMSEPRPQLPSPGEAIYSLGDELRKLAIDWIHDPAYALCDVNDYPGLAEFERDYLAVRKAISEYDAEYERQRWIQWPWAWAEAILGACPQ